MARELNSRSWYEHAVAFVDMKWPRASGNHRKSIAESLATATPALLATDRGRPSDTELRAALYGWAFNKTRREAGPPPAQLAAAAAWVQANTVRLSIVAQDASRIRAALDALATLTDGRPAAANTVARKRAVFYGTWQYAVELRLLDRNPVEHIAWTAPTSDGGVIDRTVVVNPNQARQLLAAVHDDFPELAAFFGCLYYAALRPEEALHLVEEEYERPSRPGGWGWLHLTGATVASGGWGDGAGPREDRGLKHRARGATRPVPAPPPLCDLLDAHLDRFEVGSGGRLFVLRRTSTGRLIPGQPGPVSAKPTPPPGAGHARRR